MTIFQPGEYEFDRPIIQRQARLILKYLKNELDTLEQAELDKWLQESDANQAFFNKFDDAQWLKKKLLQMEQYDSVHAWNKITQRDIAIKSTHRIHFLKTSWFRYAAAVVLIVIAISAIVMFSNQHSNQQPLVSHHKQLQKDIAPGTNRAILMVDNKQIDLASDKNGIAVDDNTVSYTDGKKLGDAGSMLTLTTPKGGQYQLVLPDGSKVWLNAVSSIKFPAAFTGTKRSVEITGEVYMEVTQNVKQPFFVNAVGSEIQVLGTSFNVNSYKDEESIRTTLVEGSVKINQVILRPGQQFIQPLNVTSAALSSDRQSKVIDLDVSQALAWKNGIFQFNQTSLASVMRQLARWYDIEVLYENGVPNIQLDGEMGRNLTLSHIVEGLQKLGVKCRMDGKKLIVIAR